MTAHKLATELLRHIDAGLPWDWLDICTRAAGELSGSPTDSDREMLLFIYTEALNYGERGKPEGQIEGFRAARSSDYFFIVMQECVDGQHLNMERLGKATVREVAAGRMAPEHELRRLAVTMEGLNGGPLANLLDAYGASILRASAVGGAVSASQLLAVTSIEVAAGRMPSGHTLKRFADSVHAVVQSFAGEARDRRC